MGITKIRHQGPRKDNDPPHCALTPDDHFVEEERVRAAKDHSHELDDFELSDTGCEHALVNEQICNIPYELYELTNLNEILSLETWNSYLTEEERFFLSVYLPDMDQETFGLTMLELLGGANIFFGNPLELFFCRLKGGFYSLQVSHYKERLKFLYERQYYHSLRSYHERMGQKIVDMRKAWKNCKPNTSVDERVQILNDKKNQKPVFLVDLNAFPVDEELSSKAEKKAKGFLKMKPLVMNMTSKHEGLQIHTEYREPFRRPPKGVLKIKPKGYLISVVERPMVISIPRDQSSNTSDFDSQWQDGTLNRKLTPELTNGRQSENALKIGSGLFDDLHSFLKKKTSTFGEFFDSQKTRVLCRSSLGLYQSVPANYERKIMPVHGDVTEAVSGNSTSVMDHYQILPNYTDHSERRLMNKKDAESVERRHIFPITYKRKKSRTNLSAVPLSAMDGS